MGQDGDGTAEKSQTDQRKARLAAELRANLQRRKQQKRARRGGAMDDAVGLPATETDTARRGE